MEVEQDSEYFSLSFFKDVFIYFGRGRESMALGAEWEGDRETQADSMLTVEPDAGLNITTLRS